MVKPDGNPPPQFSAETPSLTLFFIQRAQGRVCLYPFYHFQTMLLLPMRRVSLSPIYLSVTLLLHTWIYEKAFHLCSSIPLFPHRPCILTTQDADTCVDKPCCSSGQQGEVRHRGWTLSTEWCRQPTWEIIWGLQEVLWWVGVDFYKANLLSPIQSKKHMKVWVFIHKVTRKHFQLTANTNLQNFMEWVPNELKH